jgi:predicted DNA binding protein
MGYYEIPQAASLDAVADRLGITASSLSERLRRAQTHLIETTVAPTWPPLPE